MSAQRSYRDEVRERLLELWVRREEFGRPVGCVTTTFTFDAGFFEEECLGRFVGMDTHPQYDDERVYLVEREEKLSRLCRETVRWDGWLILGSNPTRGAIKE